MANGSRSAGGDPARSGEIQVWDVEKRKLTVSAPITYDTLYGVSWSPDSKLIAFGCADNTVRADRGCFRKTSAADGFAQ